MSWLRRHGRLAALLVVLLSVSGAAAGFLLAYLDLQAARRIERDNLLWAGSQLRIELLRFVNALRSFGHGEEGITPDDVNLRFDILWSRVETLRRGEVGEAVAQLPGARATVEVLGQALVESEPTVITLAAETRAAALPVARRFEALTPAVRELYLALSREQGRRIEAQFELVSRSSQRLSILVAFAVASTLGLLAFFAADARRERMRAREMRALLDASQAAERTRAQFLSMMSHELRTPMNGILGMLALARQPDLPAEQERLLSEATRSARALNRLLTDIVEVAGASETGEAAEPVSAEVLAADLRHLLGEAVPLSVDLPSEAMVRVDPQAVARAVSRMAECCQGLVIAARLGARGGDLCLRLEAAEGAGEALGQAFEGGAAARCGLSLTLAQMLAERVGGAWHFDGRALELRISGVAP